MSLHGQEINDRRVAPAGHMQLWPDDKSDILIVPKEPAQKTSMRMATKWRTNLTGKPKKQKPTQNANSVNSAEITPTPIVAAPTTPAPDAPASLASAPQEPINPPEAITLPPADATAPTVEPAMDKSSSEETMAVGDSESTEPAVDCYAAPPLSALSTSIALSDGKLPTDAAAECALRNPPTGDARLVGAWAGTEYHWSATCMRHRPLYFEEINAERYGYTVSYTFQPVISAARFFATIPALPYKMVVERPRDCIYTLGHYRPGSCAPRRWSRLPMKLTAAAVETGFIAGMILIIP